MLDTTILAALKKGSALLFLLLFTNVLSAFQNDNRSFEEYKGTVEDFNTGKDLVFASLTVQSTNISTITNTDGEFSLKIPKNSSQKNIVVSFLGYQDKVIKLSDLKEKGNKIQLKTSVTLLSEVDVSIPKDAKAIVKSMLNKRGSNYMQKQLTMTAFYRETIKKRKRNVSLSEAIVTVYKHPNKTNKKDLATLFKARKSTDYKKLDTIALKLQGGPFNALYTDLMKYPAYMFTPETIDYYNFSFEKSTQINNQLIYVISFKQLPSIADPLNYGKLYINAETFALTSAVFNLNVSNKEKASKLFVKRKPSSVKVYPTEAAYRVDYKEKGGKWYYSYSNIQLAFKVKWKNKLFSSSYKLTCEMAVTDWKMNETVQVVKRKNRISPSIIIMDEASGFSDPNFWGTYNVIEPEKSITSAIKKIKKQLRKLEK